MGAHGAPDASERMQRTVHWNESKTAISPEQAGALKVWRGTAPMAEFFGEDGNRDSRARRGQCVSAYAWC